MCPPSTTAVSMPSTGRSPSPATTERAFPCACSCTTASASGSSLPRHPEILGRPLPPPVAGNEVLVGSVAHLLGRVQLVQRLDLEAVRAQNLDPLAVCRVVFDAVLAGPLEAA